MVIYGKELSFKDTTHRYTWDGRSVPGVTTILGRMAKPALIQWAADMAVEHIERNAGSHAGELVVSRDLLAGARIAHRTIRDTAADIGTAVHAYADALLTGKPPEASTSEPETLGRKAFDKFLAEHRVEPIATERMVFSLNNWYAGRTDLFAKIDGKKATLDFKTSKAIYVEHWLQATAYDIALDEETGQGPTIRWVVHLDKATGRFDAQFRPHCIEHNAAFLSAVGLHRALGEIEREERAAKPKKGRKADAGDQAAVSG